MLRVARSFGRASSGSCSLASLALRRSASSFAVDSPFSGKTVAEVPLRSSAEADAVVERSAAAQRDYWWGMGGVDGLEKRIALVEEMGRLMLERKEQVAEQLSMQMGKPFQQGINEVNGAGGRLKSLTANCREILSPRLLSPKPNTVRMETREPVGVVLLLVPWNYPLLCAVNGLLPALLAGNSAVLKLSWRSPYVADFFEKVAVDAGFPEGLVSALHADNDVTHHAIEHPLVRFVSFTGSVAGGRAVYKTVAGRTAVGPIDVTLELGGKDAMYVAEDSDVSFAAASLVDGACYNAGQSCCSVERIYVHKSIYDDFLTSATAQMQQYVMDDPMEKRTSLGPIAQPHQPNLLEEHVNEAKSLGAKVLCGGEVYKGPAGQSRFFKPTLVSDCTHRMRIMTEESFGPIVGVMPVESDEEALKLMNDTDFGLTAGVYTTDRERAFSMGSRLNAGTVFMNRCDAVDPELPWTGCADSGKGISLGKHGYRGVTRLKGYNFNTSQ